MRTPLLFSLIACHGAAPPKPPPAPDATCADRACLEAHEGQVVELAGELSAPDNPKRKGHQHYLLALADGTRVIVWDAAPVTGVATGTRVTLRGRIYVKDIPERYGIIQRTSDPYLLEVSKIN